MTPPTGLLLESPIPGDRRLELREAPRGIWWGTIERLAMARLSDSPMLTSFVTPLPRFSELANILSLASLYSSSRSLNVLLVGVFEPEPPCERLGSVLGLRRICMTGAGGRGVASGVDVAIVWGDVFLSSLVSQKFTSTARWSASSKLELLDYPLLNPGSTLTRNPKFACSLWVFLHFQTTRPRPHPLVEACFCWVWLVWWVWTSDC